MTIGWSAAPRVFQWNTVFSLIGRGWLRVPARLGVTVGVTFTFGQLVVVVVAVATPATPSARTTPVTAKRSFFM